jgi:hypothetical protein
MTQTVISKNVGARSALERVFPSTESDVTDEDEDKTISSLIARYKRAAKKTTENVCERMFP